MSARRLGWLALALGAGYAFLYLPIATLILFSFNASRLVTVWGGFSTRWYGELLANERLLDAAALSLMLAAASATVATAIGTLAGVALARLGRFRARGLLNVLIAAPLVMPEIVTGISLLLLFVSLERLTGWPEERGLTTLTLAHATLGIAYVAVVVRARLADADPALEEAAADLGARPLAILLRVTLPVAAPALVAGWLLAFTLSLDDLVVSSFVAGPGATTLPMLIFASVRLGLSPQINALATVIVAVVAITVGTAAWLAARARK